MDFFLRVFHVNQTDQGEGVSGCLGVGVSGCLGVGVSGCLVFGLALRSPGWCSNRP